MKKTFIMYLDESGSFKKDKDSVKRGKNPSLIGGVLFEENNFTLNHINQIIGTESIHCTEDKDVEKQFQRFMQINANNVQLILFQNTECIWILDNNLTYLNIMTEGIIKTLTYLKQKYGDILLKVLIANRVDTTANLPKMESVVQKDVYIKRLQEKLILSSLDKQIKKDDWQIEKASAREDKRLMIADIVCNTFYMRNLKFPKPMQEEITKIYQDKNKTIIFSVLESFAEKEFTKYLLENRLGEAVSLLCQRKDENFIADKMRLVQEKLLIMTRSEIELQYRFIATRIENFIEINNDFTGCIMFLKNLLKYFLPKLKNIEEIQELTSKLNLDINFYLITAYSHTGNIKEIEDCLQTCDKEIENLSNNWESINYQMKYQNRKIVHYSNLFEFTYSLNSCKDLVKKCKGIKSVLELCYEDKKPIKYEELAKALGNLVQIYTFLLRSNQAYYIEAKQASDEAIEEFEYLEDKKRQYLYRCALETEANNYDNALAFLFQSVGLTKDQKLENLVKKLEESSSYTLMQYIRLMAEGKLAGWQKADTMAQVIFRSPLLNSKNHFSPKHPYEIISWKWATYLMETGNTKAAIEKYDMALSFGFEEDSTLNMIGFAIELEKYSYLLKYNIANQLNSVKKSLQKHYQKISQNFKNNIFETIDFEKVDSQYYFALSRKITY